MARNVSHNVESLEMHISTITNKNGIVKRRYVDNRSGQMVLRVDEHDYCDRIKKKVLENIRDNKCKPYFSGETAVDAADRELKEEFRKHIDTSTKSSSKRFLSTLIYLNDVEEGGQTVFNDVAINPRQGRLILFPPLWLFPHSGRIPISNIKYLLTTYLRYSV